jgi:hypothetical protein
VAATAASTFSDKPRWEKDIEPLQESAVWSLGKILSRSTPERHANMHGILKDTLTGGLLRRSRFDSGPR